MPEEKNEMPEIRPLKLQPPPEAVSRMIEKDKNRPGRNKIVIFFKTFFGEGF